MHGLKIFGPNFINFYPYNFDIFIVTWSPSVLQFVVVYGYMPAKATVFNRKCESVFDFGTGPRNVALFNPQGNLVLLGGFGNLRGNIEIWDVKDKKKASTKNSMPGYYAISKS